MFDEITQRKTYHFIAYRASFLACFVSLVRISEAFETSSFTYLDDFLYFGLKYKKPSRMLGYVGCTFVLYSQQTKGVHGNIQNLNIVLFCKIRPALLLNFITIQESSSYIYKIL